MGHRVDLLTYPQGRAVDVPGLRHRRSLRLPVGRVGAGPSIAKLLLDVPFVVQAAWLIATHRYDAVHATEESAHLISPLARLFRVPLVTDMDSSIPDQLRESGFATRGPLLWLAELLERHALNHSSVVITVCRSLTERVKRRAPLASVFQIEDPPLIDAPASPNARDVAALRESMGLGALPIALYAGNFEPYQGVELLVDAAARLPGVRLLLVGGEPAAIEAMRERALRAGAGERCVFAGQRPVSDLPLFLASADVLVSPRLRGENTPFKLYTYLASGKPVVATRIPSHTQLVDDSLALLVDATAEGVAAGIRQALSDPRNAADRAARARALIEREYGAARYQEKVRRAYGALTPRATR
jgi:glycosyltransferase involved in cell wall biosynthesis